MEKQNTTNGQMSPIDEAKLAHMPKTEPWCEGQAQQEKIKELQEEVTRLTLENYRLLKRNEDLQRRIDRRRFLDVLEEYLADTDDDEDENTIDCGTF